MFDAAALSAAVLDELGRDPRSLDALCAKFGVSKEKIKIALAGLEVDKKAYRGQVGPQSPVLWRAGPKPAPVPTPNPANDVLDESPVITHPLEEAWTTPEDVIAHAQEQIRASGANFDFGHYNVIKLVQDVGAEHLEDVVDHVADRSLLKFGLKLTKVKTLTGDNFVAVPHGARERPGRRWVRYRDEAAAEQLVRFPSAVWSPKKEDGEKKSPDRIERELSIVAKKGMLLDGCAPTSYLDLEGLFHYRCWELLPMPAERSPTVEAYFESWGTEQKRKLEDYFATLALLSHPAPGLLTRASRSTGKDMLALAAARNFRAFGGACSLESAAANFNADLEQSPVVVASEKLPDRFGNVPFDLEVLKRLITEETRMINGKFLAAVPQRGCIRLMFSTNATGNPFPVEGFLGGDSVDALLERVLFVEPPVDKSTGLSAPAKWLADKGGREFTASWIEDAAGNPGALVKHVRWIIENHVPTKDPSGRFACRPDGGKLANIIRASGRIASLVIAGVVAHLAGEKHKLGLGKAIQPGGGRVLVQIATLHGAWALLTSGTGDHEARRIAPTLSQFAHEISEAVCLPGDVRIEGDARAWREMRADLLLAHAAAVGLSVSDIQAALSLSTPRT